MRKFSIPENKECKIIVISKLLIQYKQQLHLCFFIDFWSSKTLHTILFTFLRNSWYVESKFVTEIPWARYHFEKSCDLIFSFFNFSGKKFNFQQTRQAKSKNSICQKAKGAHSKQPEKGVASSAGCKTKKQAKQIDVRVSLQFLLTDFNYVFRCGGVALHGGLKVAKNHFQSVYYPTRLRRHDARRHTSHHVEATK